MALHELSRLIAGQVAAYFSDPSEATASVLSAQLQSSLAEFRGEEGALRPTSMFDLESIAVPVGPNTSSMLAQRLAIMMADELDRWRETALQWNAAFTSTFEPSLVRAANECRALAAAATMPTNRATARRARDLVRVLQAATGATPDEPVGFIEYGWSLEAEAAFLYGLIALTLSFDDARDADTEGELKLVESLAGDLDRLQTTLGAAEEMVSLLLALADRDDVHADAAVSAERLAAALSSLAKSPAPPPRSFNAAMLDAAQLLRRHDPPVDEVATQIATTDDLPVALAGQRARALDELADDFVGQPENDDGAGYTMALHKLADLGSDLTEEESTTARETLLRRFRRSSTGIAATKGYLGGVEKLLENAISKGIPAGVIEGLGWVLQHRSWLGALIRFAIGILA